jgi:hypothetical protein
LAWMKARSFFEGCVLGSWSLMICILNLRDLVYSWTPVGCEMKEPTRLRVEVPRNPISHS